MASKAKVNLDLLKRLVSELEKSLDAADAISSDPDANSYVTELARASGLASVIMQESSMLVKDVYILIQQSSGGGAPSEGEVMAELSKLFGGPPPKRNSN
jgi:hypothetical protein